ncbi:unnamed protein product [Strongylus vulgaris]|uniref:Uncharacterized protein n=1 Tax=Strongylus vulgaris TaxID=40348 RepID=A0A3P7J9V3_STRVU|nr:unnamed protein product [Strongylus vulgaris]
MDALTSYLLHHLIQDSQSKNRFHHHFHPVVVDMDALAMVAVDLVAQADLPLSTFTIVPLVVVMEDPVEVMEDKVSAMMAVSEAEAVSQDHSALESNNLKFSAWHG